jgi:hypothetical protein
MRLATSEYALRAEVKQMRASTDLQRRRAGREEVELTQQNLADMAKEQLAIVLHRVKKEGDKALQAEKDRQNDTALDFEKEKLSAAFRRARRDAEMRLRVASAQRAVAAEVHAALMEKGSVLRDLLEQHDPAEGAPVSDQTKKLTIQQIDSEMQREELELRAAFTALSSSFTVAGRYVGEMLDGAEPSNAYAVAAFTDAHARAAALSHAALREDHLRRRLKKTIQANNQRDTEERRLMLLGRPPEDLAKIYRDIDGRLERELTELDATVAEERASVDALLAAQRDEKHAVQSTYRDEVEKLRRAHVADTHALREKYAADLAAVPSGGAKEGSDDAAAQRVEVAAGYAAAVSAARLRHEEQLFEAFKRQMTTEALVEKAEDDLRQVETAAHSTFFLYFSPSACLHPAFLAPADTHLPALFRSSFLPCRCCSSRSSCSKSARRSRTPPRRRARRASSS